MPFLVGLHTLHVDLGLIARLVICLCRDDCVMCSLRFAAVRSWLDFLVRGLFLGGDRIKQSLFKAVPVQTYNHSSYTF